jgi:uncharacterized membrane protein YhfC
VEIAMPVPSLTIAGLACAAVLSMLAPFAAYAYGRKRMALPGRNVGVGALLYILFAMLLEGALFWYVFRINPATQAFMKQSAWGQACFLAASAALFEESCRFIGLRFFARRVAAPGTAVSYGIGHGGIECLSVAVVQTGGVLLCILANLGVLDSGIVPMFTTAGIAQAYGDTGFLTALLGGTERITALLVQIGFSLLVWRAVATGKARWFFLAMLAHFSLDFVSFMAGKGLYSIMALECAVLVLGGVLLAVYLRGAPQRLAAA